MALHNWLLHYNGLDKEWKRGEKSDWEGSLGRYVPPTLSAARFFARVSSSTDSRNRHLGFGFGNDASEHYVTEEEGLHLVDPAIQQYQLPDGSRVVRKMPLQLFRSKLVEQFDIQFKRSMASTKSNSRMGIRGVGIK